MNGRFYSLQSTKVKEGTSFMCIIPPSQVRSPANTRKDRIIEMPFTYSKKEILGLVGIHEGGHAYDIFLGGEDIRNQSKYQWYWYEVKQYKDEIHQMYFFDQFLVI